MRPGTRVLLLGAALSAGCAHLTTTDRLDEARAVYDKAQQGPAGQSSPADLATAKKFLDLAEKSLQTGDPKLVDDQATVAILKVQSAEALGRTHELAAERDRTLQAVNVTKQQLLDEAKQKLMLTQAELEKERAARDAMTARLTQSRSTLAQETQIRDLPEGTVITLPGGALFQQGQAELLPAGRDQLSRVADFLKSADRSARVTAQPPSRGSRKAALSLSGKRAERVRDYLVGEGVTARQIIAEPPTATPTRPLPNSPEFATNGAVDIVLEPARGGANGTSVDGKQ
jgi:outer membrane protein OmpA-like peptidoglycan-associated protein